MSKEERQKCKEYTFRIRYGSEAIPEPILKLYKKYFPSIVALGNKTKKERIKKVTFNNLTRKYEF